MELGVSMIEREVDCTKHNNKWNIYYASVYRDYWELKDQYPFAYLSIPPTINPSMASVKVIAANNELIKSVYGTEEDFLGEYTKELLVRIPLDYKKSGCRVYGAKWIDKNKLRKQDWHFNDDARLKSYGYELCVGTPESFALMPNVILENVRTAERMLIAYEQVMTGATDKLNLIAYAHGEVGRQQFRKSLTKYVPERREKNVKTKEE